MRKPAILLLLFSALPTYAQAQSSAGFRRYEVGAQFDVSYLSGVGDWGGGFGARLHYNFDEHFALDSELIFRQHDVALFNGTAAFTGAVGQTTGLFGVRAGQRFDSDGFFFHARAGFLHFGSDQGLTLLSRNTFPAFDAGGTLEHYSGPVILRLELGEMVVPYGNARAFSGVPVLPSQPQPSLVGTRANPVLGFGFAVRF